MPTPFLTQFTDFLKTVPLKKYREAYSSVKIVEMDLSKDIQAIELLYTVYWSEKKFISFDDFYERSRRYGLIMKDFLVGKGDFSSFLSFGGFRGIFGKL